MSKPSETSAEQTVRRTSALSSTTRTVLRSFCMVPGRFRHRASTAGEVRHRFRSFPREVRGASAHSLDNGFAGELTIRQNMYEARVKPWLLPETAQALGFDISFHCFSSRSIHSGTFLRNIFIATDPDWVARRVSRRADIAERVSCGLTVLTTVLLSILGKLWHLLRPHKRKTTYM